MPKKANRRDAIEPRKCQNCQVLFKPKNRNGKFCGKECSLEGYDAGRKWFDGRDEKEVIEKCKEVWKIGGTDTEAAFFAEVSHDSVSAYVNAHPELIELRDRLREYPNLKMRRTIVGSLDDVEQAWRYAERKKKEEFGPNATTIINNNVDLAGEAKVRLEKYQGKKV